MDNIILLGFLFAIVGLSVYLVMIYNGLVVVKNDIDKAWANIDVMLKQRHDELPKLIEVCKGYMNFERDTLQKINYPELKANNNFMQLQTRITELESQIADRREFYNDSVNTFNIRIQEMPDTFVAAFMNLKPRAMFKVEEADKADVPVSFAATK